MEKSSVLSGDASLHVTIEQEKKTYLGRSISRSRICFGSNSHLEVYLYLDPYFITPLRTIVNTEKGKKCSPSKDNTYWEKSIGKNTASKCVFYVILRVAKCIRAAAYSSSLFFSIIQ